MAETKAKEVLILHQPSRVVNIPNASPWCLKLETWLRMGKIPYEVDPSYVKRSKKGQFPFVDYQGKEYADSSLIIAELSKLFLVDLNAHLSLEQNAVAQAFEGYVAESLFWPLLYERRDLAKEFFGEEMQGKERLGLPTPVRRVSIIRKLVTWKFVRQQTGRLMGHGMGRNSKEEMLFFANRALDAINVILGSRKYIAGEEISQYDATVFGMIGVIYYQNIHSMLKEHIGSSCPNIVAYLSRIKEAYWPDWEDAAVKMLANTQWMKDNNKTLLQ